MRVVVGSSVTMVAACWSRHEQQAGQHTASRTDAAIALPAPPTHFQILCGGSFTKRLSSYETRPFSGSPVLKKRNNRGTPMSLRKQSPPRDGTLAEVVKSSLSILAAFFRRKANRHQTAANENQVDRERSNQRRLLLQLRCQRLTAGSGPRPNKDKKEIVIRCSIQTKHPGTFPLPSLPQRWYRFSVCATVTWNPPETLAQS